MNQQISSLLPTIQEVFKNISVHVVLYFQKADEETKDRLSNCLNKSAKVLTFNEEEMKQKSHLYRYLNNIILVSTPSLIQKEEKQRSCRFLQKVKILYVLTKDEIMARKIKMMSHGLLEVDQVFDTQPDLINAVKNYVKREEKRIGFSSLCLEDFCCQSFALSINACIRQNLNQEELISFIVRMKRMITDQQIVRRVQQNLREFQRSSSIENWLRLKHIIDMVNKVLINTSTLENIFPFHPLISHLFTFIQRNSVKPIFCLSEMTPTLVQRLTSFQIDYFKGIKSAIEKKSSFNPYIQVKNFLFTALRNHKQLEKELQDSNYNAFFEITVERAEEVAEYHGYELQFCETNDGTIIFNAGNVFQITNVEQIPSRVAGREVLKISLKYGPFHHLQRSIKKRTTSLSQERQESLKLFYEWRHSIFRNPYLNFGDIASLLGSKKIANRFYEKNIEIIKDELSHRSPERKKNIIRLFLSTMNLVGVKEELLVSSVKQNFPNQIIRQLRSLEVYERQVSSQIENQRQIATFLILEAQKNMKITEFLKKGISKSIVMAKQSHFLMKSSQKLNCLIENEQIDKITQCKAICLRVIIEGRYFEKSDAAESYLEKYVKKLGFATFASNPELYIEALLTILKDDKPSGILHTIYSVYDRMMPRYTELYVTIKIHHSKYANQQKIRANLKKCLECLTFLEKEKSLRYKSISELISSSDPITIQKLDSILNQDNYWLISEVQESSLMSSLSDHYRSSRIFSS